FEEAVAARRLERGKAPAGAEAGGEVEEADEEGEPAPERRGPRGERAFHRRLEHGPLRGAGGGRLGDEGGGEGAESGPKRRRQKSRHGPKLAPACRAGKSGLASQRPLGSPPMSSSIASGPRAGGGVAANVHSRAAEDAPGIARTASAVLVAAALIAVGLTWDIAWHRSVGRDTFWTAPHVVEYL